MSSKVVCFIGCYTHENSKNGIYCIEICPNSGKLEILNKFEAENVSYFAQSNPYLYAVSEGAPPLSRLWRFRIDNTTPYQLNDPYHVGLFEDGACFLHVTNLSERAKRLAIAFYNSGAVQFFEDVEGVIKTGPKNKFTEFSNHNSIRQEMPHIHCVRPLLTNTGGASEYFVVDLGADRIYLVHVNNSNETLSITDSIQMSPGSGPRHVLQHPNHPLLFILNELDNTLCVYKIEKDQKFVAVEKHSTLVKSNTDFIVDSDEIQYAAHLAVSDCGQFVLCSNRGRLNNVVVFHIQDPELGSLALRSVAGSCGHFPRYFALHGKLIIVANQLSRNVVAFKFEDGYIKEKLSEISLIENPVALHVYIPGE